MYILEIVIVFLVLLLLYSTGWFVRIIQLLVARFLDFGRAFIESIIRQQIEKPEVKKKPKRS
jgi:hypothetical protein